MKTNLLKLLALLSMIAPLAANANGVTVTYDVNRMIGAGSVMGTITTDGTIGVLASTNIYAWAINVNDGVDSLSFNSTDAGAVLVIAGSSFTSTAVGLYFDFAGFAGGLKFASASSGFGFEWVLSAPAIGSRTETVAHRRSDNTLAHGEGVLRSGVHQIATVQATGLPEPGTLGLALIGLAGLGFSRKRKQRQSAAV